jgi:hypothetical protein
LACTANGLDQPHPSVGAGLLANAISATTVPNDRPDSPASRLLRTRLFRHHRAERQIGFASKPAPTNAIIQPPPCRMADRVRQQAGSYERDYSATTVPNDRPDSPASRLLRTRLFSNHRAERQIGFASKPAPTHAIIPPPPCRMTDRVRQQAGPYERDYSATTVPNDRPDSPASRLLRTRLFSRHRAE